jgi:hypothetical protein
MSPTQLRPAPGCTEVSPGKLRQELLGVWALLSYTDQRDELPDVYPFGREPEGILIYTADGFVSAQLMNPARGAARSAAWHGGDPTELANLAAGYIAYCGQYVLDEARRVIAHIPVVALLPSLLGAPQHRTISIDVEVLTLRTEAMPGPDGRLVSSRLEWTKVPRRRPPDARGPASGSENARHPSPIAVPASG